MTRMCHRVQTDRELVMRKLNDTKYGNVHAQYMCTRKLILISYHEPRARISGIAPLLHMVARTLPHKLST